MSLGTARHQKPGQPGRTAEGEGEKPDPKHFVMKQGWRGMSRKAWGEQICLGRCSREGTWSWHGDVSRPIAAERG